MKTVLGVTPTHHDYIQDSRLCGNCHTINLPVMDKTPFGHSLEQSTYLEWLNRTIAVATAKREARRVLLSAYRLL